MMFSVWFYHNSSGKESCIDSNIETMQQARRIIMHHAHKVKNAKVRKIQTKKKGRPPEYLLDNMTGMYTIKSP